MIKIKYNKNTKKKKYFKLAKGFLHSNSCLLRKVKEQVIQSLYSAYIGRKLKKRIFKSLWIYRIKASLKNNNNKYSIFIGYLRKFNIFINKKMLSILAYTNISDFYIIQKIISIFIFYFNTKINLYFNYIKFIF
jgi:large subunit ribosomal protein L20